MNVVVLIGRLTKDVDLRETQDGNYVASFNIAIDRQLSKDKKAEYESKGWQTADFPRITVWGTQARNCATYLQKGRLVAVRGRIQTGSYEKDGVRVYTTEVVADNVQFLEWGDREGGQGGGGGSQRQAQQSSQPAEIPKGFEAIDEDDLPF